MDGWLTSTASSAQLEAPKPHARAPNGSDRSLYQLPILILFVSSVPLSLSVGSEETGDLGGPLDTSGGFSRSAGAP